MQLAIFGLGKMGAQIVRRLHKNNYPVCAWNRSEGPRREISAAGIPVFADIPSAAGALDGSPRIFWIMLPQGAVDEFLLGPDLLGSVLREGDIVIDGGNSFYKDSMRRSRELAARGVVFYDCGTSGGVWGEDNGFALMVGGPKQQWSAVEPIFRTLSAGSNYGLVGGNGAGHFVKMVHNGIEYGMMESIAEGYGVLKASPFELDLSQVTGIYQEGSVIRSWLIDLTKNIFDHENIEEVSGVIASTGEGQWTVEAGKELGVDVRVLEGSLAVRRESELPENRAKFSNKIVALLRKQFGGHATTRPSAHFPE